MSVKILHAKSDIIFKLFFSDERNVDLLKDFLKSVLDLPEDDYNDITVTDPHLLREYPDDKLGILDVKLKSKTGKIINIEIQVKPLPGMKPRVMFYGAKLITEQIGDGGDYEVIKRVINIIITDHDLVAGSQKYHHRFLMYDPENEVAFSDIWEIHTLELPKLPKKTDGSELWNWLKFIDAETEDELTMVAEKSPQVKKAVGRLMELSADERARMLYEAREKEQRDNRAREKGAVKVVAKNMLEDKEPIEKIIKYTGLLREEVELLRETR